MEIEINQREAAEDALRQAKSDLEVRVEARTAELTQAAQELAMGKQRYSRLVENLPAAVYTTDAQGRVTLYHEATAILWGRQTEIGKDLWCGSYPVLDPTERLFPLDEYSDGGGFKDRPAGPRHELIVERLTDGVRRNVLGFPDAMHDASGRIYGSRNMLLDATESKHRGNLAAACRYSLNP